VVRYDSSFTLFRVEAYHHVLCVFIKCINRCETADRGLRGFFRQWALGSLLCPLDFNILLWTRSITLLVLVQVNQGGEPGHLVMNGGYMEWFMDPSVALMYLRLRKELDDLISRKLANPELNIFEEGKVLMRAVFEVLDADQCEGSFTFGRKLKTPRPLSKSDSSDVKGLLQTVLQRAGKKPPVYRTRMMKGQLYQSSIEVKGRGFTGDPAISKKLAEKNVSTMALEWLTGLSKPKRMA
jgi:ATP-dependent RNA helicase DHX36